MILELTVVNYAYNMVPSFPPFLPLLRFSEILGKAPNLSRISMDFKNEHKTHWSYTFPFPAKPKADGLQRRAVRVTRGAWGDESGSWRGPKRKCSWRNDAEKPWQWSTHLGIDIRVKGAVLFEFFDLKSILQKGEEKKMWRWNGWNISKQRTAARGRNTRTRPDLPSGSLKLTGWRSPGLRTHRPPLWSIQREPQ